ncbi:MFS transporter [Rothia sp. CCM 9419]|uniref:MFS transporter n=1 Tax=Rothia sp. CCM 9419 TaxID=3402662 RepID=UPI003AE0437F
MQENVLRMPGMVPILATFAAVMSSLSILLPASPAWVTAGGAGASGAGLVTATLMGVTVLTQLVAVRRMLTYIGWPVTVCAGTLFMGLPSPLQALSSDLWVVLLSSALRGIGFGIVTVCGSTALSILIPSHRRGTAVGLYGLAAAIPQVIFTPLAPWLIEVLGYGFVLSSGLIAVAGAPFAWKLGRLVEEHTSAEPSVEGVDGLGSVILRIWPALLTLTLITAAGGAFFTFATELGYTPALATLALLCLTAVGVPTRLYGGSLTDRWGTRILMTPILGASSVGIAGIGISAGMEEGSSRATVFIVSTVILGIGYGFLQSVSMVRALADAGAKNGAGAAVLWNSNFDIGTGLGGLAVGAMAQVAGFPVAWWIWAVLVLAGAVVMGLGDMKSSGSRRS